MKVRHGDLHRPWQGCRSEALAKEGCAFSARSIRPRVTVRQHGRANSTKNGLCFGCSQNLRNANTTTYADMRKVAGPFPILQIINT